MLVNWTGQLAGSMVVLRVKEKSVLGMVGQSQGVAVGLKEG